MPTYEYVCLMCRTEYTVTRKHTDPVPSLCGDCGGTLRRRFFPVGVVFRGPGFYTTDKGEK